MLIATFAARLAASGRAIPALLEGMSDDDARWRPAKGGWSIVEIVNHLADEETEDFRTRLRLTLETPEAEWPGIDPEGAVLARQHGEKPLAPSLARFADERSSSLAWLATLDDGVDLRRTHVHKVIGDLRAGDLLASWAAHDVLHLRQLGVRLHQLVAKHAAPYSTDYAGPGVA
ncbi:MAG: DinB family protein [Planctomycetes bacterium]|nr:DinB family protein [Planctomycetota bacterium]